LRTKSVISKRKSEGTEEEVEEKQEEEEEEEETLIKRELETFKTLKPFLRSMQEEEYPLLFVKENVVFNIST
jgi:hypothetical protein